MRNIDPGIWRDEWFSELEPIGKLIWLGIISTAADDQGRLLLNASLVKSELFPLSEAIDAEQVANWLYYFIGDGKLISYFAGGKKLIQIQNWWKYQFRANFMNASKYQPPEGWVDCWRFHGKGNQEIKSTNWLSKEAGFIKLPSQLPSQQGSDDVKDDVKDKEEDEGEGGQTPPAPAPAYNSFETAKAIQEFNQNAPLTIAADLLNKISQMATIPITEREKIDVVYQMVHIYGADKTEEALRKTHDTWVSKVGKSGRTYSPLNFGWVDWALAELAGTGRGEKPEKLDPMEPLYIYMAEHNIKPIEPKPFVPNPNGHNPLKQAVPNVSNNR